MKDFRDQNFYELLELEPCSDAEAIQRSYDQACRIFSSDSPATYALFPPLELEFLRKRLDEAFKTLSDPERRKRYDQQIASFEGQEFFAPAVADLMPETGPAAAEADPLLSRAVVDSPSQPVGAIRNEMPEVRRESDNGWQKPSVEREVTWTRARSSEDPARAYSRSPNHVLESSRPATILECGSTEPAQPRALALPAESPRSALPDRADPPPPLPDSLPSGPAVGEAASSPPACSEPAESGRPPMPVLTAETEITGALLQQARMALGWTLEKLVDVTKISIYYLRNLEREDTSDLPAPVYMRGYLRLLAKIYKLDPARFVEGYLDRLEKIKKAQ